MEDPRELRRTARTDPGQPAHTRAAVQPSPRLGPRTLRVIHVQYGFALGGLERVVLELATGARPSGVAGSVVSFGPDGPMRAVLERAGVPVAWLRDAPGVRARTVLRMARAFREARADVVHAHDVGPLVNAALAARLASGVPVVATLHGSARPAPAHRLLGRAAAGAAAAVVACGDEVGRAALGWGLRADRLVENGVALGALPSPAERRAARVALGVEDDATVVVGYVGRLSREKGVDVLLDAHAEAFGGRADVRLVVIGDGELRAELEARARGAVTFLGARPDARRLLPGFDVYAHPSRSEGRSLALLDAMAAGLPTVASRIAAVEEIHRDGATALLCAVEDRAGVAGALARLAGSPAERARLGAGARERVRAWDVETMVASYVALYREVAAAAAGCGPFRRSR